MSDGRPDRVKKLLNDLIFMRRLLILLALSLTTASYAQVSKIEKKITTAIDANNSSALKLLEEAVNINSGSMNFDGVFNFIVSVIMLAFKVGFIAGGYLFIRYATGIERARLDKGLLLQGNTHRKQHFQNSYGHRAAYICTLS